MSSAKLIIKNTGILVFGEVLSRVFSLFLIVFIARYLGEIGLGKYSFVFAFVGVFSVLSDFGVNTYMTRELSRDASLAKEYLGKIFVFKLMIALLSTVLPVLFIIFTNQFSEIKIGVFLAAASMFIYYMAFPFRVVVNIFEIQGYQSLYVISERVVAVILGIYVLQKGYGLLALLIVLVVSNASSWLLLFSLVSKNLIRLKPKTDIKFVKSFLKKSIPFWFTTVFMTIYFKIDTVMLSFMKDYAATGWYNASYKIIDALSFLPFVVITTVFPAMSKFFKKSDNLLHILYEKTFYYLAALALPLGIGTSLLASRIIIFVYKQSFLNSVVVLQILIWALVLMFVNYIMGYLLNSIDKQHLFTYTTGICAVFNILLNFVLIPLYSFKGAAIATVATELLNFIVLYYFTSKNGYAISIPKTISKSFIASALMGAVIIYFGNLHLLLLIPLCIALYFFVLFVIGGIKEEEKKLLLSFARMQ